MRALHQSDEFSSLTYRDMPFVLSPNIWSKVSNINRKSMQEITRANDDGILVDFDSPEALDEVFWRVFSGNSYIHSTHLVPHEADDDLITALQDYVALINLKYSRNRYLSKNNNNILRLSSITNAFPNAIVFIPFREPLQHAFSLLRQHQNFVNQHREDKFSEKYMSWLVHHEFGRDHRPFRLVDNIYQPRDINTIEYWLYQWINVYSFLLERINKLRRRVFFVGYEDICRKDRVVWQILADLAEIPLDSDFVFTLKKEIIPTMVDKNLKEQASEIYYELLAYSRK